MKLSVVIPAYNEENRISKTLIAVNKYLSAQKYASEILVVIDGATDKTFDVVKGHQKQIKNLVIQNNSKNHGKGYVVRQGLLKAQGDYRLFMDADNSTTVDHIEKFFPHFEKGYDLVIGSRDIKGSQLKKRQPFWKEFLGNAGNLMIQMVGGLWGIPDTQCGFKALTAGAAENICQTMKIDRWGFDIEMLVLARKAGYKIKEVPVVWINDEASKVSFLSYFNTLKELFQIKFNLLLGNYRIKPKKKQQP
ncbi:MAG: glycosyltransferase [Candidatus Moranbacteria bacterium]|nr:glycosyltransferase [Candidatus Moranbacteria bacterium]